VKFVLAEFDLAGGGGFTLVEERPKVFECHLKLLPAESHSNTSSTVTARFISLKVTTTHTALHIQRSSTVWNHLVSCWEQTQYCKWTFFENEFRMQTVGFATMNNEKYHGSMLALVVISRTMFLVDKK